MLSNSNHSVILWMWGCASLTLNASWNISLAAVLSRQGLGRIFICKVILCWISSLTEIVVQPQGREESDLGALGLINREWQP